MRVNNFSLALTESLLDVQLVRETGQNYRGIVTNSPESVFQLMNSVFKLGHQAEEYCYLLCFNTKSKLLGVFEVSHGTVNASLLSTREIFMRALLIGAVHVIVVHNHPSGDPTPSNDDISTSRKIKDAGQLLGVKLLDSIVVCANSYSSLKEQGQI